MAAFVCPGCSAQWDVPDPAGEILCPACGRASAVNDQTQPLPLAPAAGNPDATFGPSDPQPAPRDDRAPAGYEVLGELGRGGMGVVYKARQIKLDRLVALKMILSGAHAGPDELARFQTEAEAIARLQHPGIVAIHEVGQHEGRPFFSLEFCAGGSLEKKLAGTPMRPEEAAKLAHSLADAVQAAHEAKVVHRDLKPANVLLSDASRERERPEWAPPVAHAPGSPLVPKITDFGLAKKLDEQSRTQTGAIMGTPSYLAPEQARGEKDVGPAADVYALGAILYECLTGRPPFKAATAMETLLQVTHDEPVPPRQLNPRIPRDLETIVLKCLHKEPSKRYGTARDLGDDLGRFLAGRPIVARPIGTLGRAAKWVGRNKAAAALLGTVAASLLLGAVVSGYFAYDARQQAAAAKAERANAIEQAALAEEKTKLAQTHADAEAAAKATAQDETRRAEREKERTQQALLRAETALYAGKLARAQQAYENGNGALALRLLDECQWDLRGWEYRHLRARFDSETTFCRHDVLLGLAVSPDGKWLASCGKSVRPGGVSAELFVWDVAKAKVIRRLQGHSGPVYCAAFSPDGKRLVSGGEDKKFVVWDLEKGEPIDTLKGNKARVKVVTFSPDGKHVVTGGLGKPGELIVWDFEQGKPLRRLPGHAAGVTAVAVSRDGKRIVSASEDNTLKVWPFEGGDAVTLKGHVAAVKGAAFSRDGNHVLSGGDETVRVWDAATGKELRSWKCPQGAVASLALAPDGKRVVAGTTAGQIHAWDVETANQDLQLSGHKGAVISVAFSPDGARLFSGSEDRTIKSWNAHRGQRLFGDDGTVANAVHSCVAIDGAGRRLARVSGEKVTLWDVERGERSRALPLGSAWIGGIALGPDGALVAVGVTEGLRVWDAKTGGVRLKLDFPCNPFPVAISPDNELIYGSVGATLRAWDARTGKVVFTVPDHASRITAIWISPDGGRVASAARGELKVSDGKTGRVLFTYRSTSFFCVDAAFSPDGERLVTGTDANDALVLDAKGAVVRRLKGHVGHVHCVAYNRDGSRIVSGGSDAAIRVWDTEGREVQTLLGHSGELTRVAFSPDGSRLFSGGSDRTVRVWDTKTGLELASFDGPPNVSLLALSPAGDRLVAASRSGPFQVYPTPARDVPLTVQCPGGPVNAVAFSGDGRRLIAGGVAGLTIAPSKGEARVWDVVKGLEVGRRGADREVGQVALGHDGKRAAMLCALYPTALRTARDAVLSGWDVESGDELFSVQKTPLAGPLRFSTDGRRLLGPAREWDAVTGKSLGTRKEPPGTLLVGSTDGRWAATLVGRDRELQVWDTERGEVVVLPAKWNQVSSAAFSPDGRRFYVGLRTGMLEAWDVAAKRQLFSVRAHEEGVNCLAVSPDGSLIASGGEDNAVKVFDGGGVEVHTFEGHVDRVACVAFSPDGARLASGSRDGTVKVWSLAGVGRRKE